jgi:hypothetical protein
MLYKKLCCNITVRLVTINFQIFMPYYVTPYITHVLSSTALLQDFWRHRIYLDSSCILDQKKLKITTDPTLTKKLRRPKKKNPATSKYLNQNDETN